MNFFTGERFSRKQAIIFSLFLDDWSYCRNRFKLYNNYVIKATKGFYKHVERILVEKIGWGIMRWGVDEWGA